MDVFFLSRVHFYARPAKLSCALIANYSLVRILVHDVRPWYVRRVFGRNTPDRNLRADPRRLAHHRARSVPHALRSQTGNPGNGEPTTRRPIALTRIIPAAPHCNAGTAISCARQWKRKDLPSTKPSGGTSTTKTGNATASATNVSRTSAISDSAHGFAQSGKMPRACPVEPHNIRYKPA